MSSEYTDPIPLKWLPKEVLMDSLNPNEISLHNQNLEHNFDGSIALPRPFLLKLLLCNVGLGREKGRGSAESKKRK